MILYGYGYVFKIMMDSSQVDLISFNPTNSSIKSTHHIFICACVISTNRTKCGCGLLIKILYLFIYFCQLYLFDQHVFPLISSPIPISNQKGSGLTQLSDKRLAFDTNFRKSTKYIAKLLSCQLQLTFVICHDATWVLCPVTSKRKEERIFHCLIKLTEIALRT